MSGHPSSGSYLIQLDRILHIASISNKIFSKQEGIMKKITVLLIFIGLLSVIASCAVSNQGSVYQEGYSYYNQNVFKERIEKQQQSINQGMESGKLTSKEKKLLQDNLNWIQKRYERMTADRILTKNEQESLDKMLDKNNEMIKDKKNNPAKQLYETDIQYRIDSQQSKIYQGITSGEFTRHEADILQDNLNDIRKRYTKMRQDSVLTTKELEKLDKMLNENSKMIYRKEINREYDIKRLF
jgi:hypothetical protein